MLSEDDSVALTQRATQSNVQNTHRAALSKAAQQEAQALAKAKYV